MYKPYHNAQVILRGFVHLVVSGKCLYKGRKQTEEGICARTVYGPIAAQ